METTNRNYAFVAPFVAALADLGLRHACVTPGSRNTPLALALASEPRVHVWVHHDERAASFFAMGMARTLRAPVAVATTSGTAAAELHPAVVEAGLSRLPLIVLTADRPPELRGVGAPQTIDQVKLYGDAVRWFHEVGNPTPGSTAPALAATAWTAATDVPPGPVHLNFPFREPLVADGLPTPPRSAAPQVLAGRIEPQERAVTEVAALLTGRRTLIVCGQQDDPSFPSAAAELASALRAPILADPLSQMRAGTHDLSHVLATGGPLAQAGMLDREPPEVVVRFGAVPTSKALYTWLADHPDVAQVLVDAAGWRDPGSSVTTALRADATAAAGALAKAVSAPGPASFTSAWRTADAAAAAAIDAAITAEGFPTEPGIVAALAAALPAGATLWAASSMPVRDVDSFLPRIDRPLRVLANRGANGIDGFLSSGIGSALAGGDPAYLLAGDLSTLHDATALGAAARLGADVTIVVAHNDGGGIFHFLPQADHPEHFEELLGTPHGTDFVALAGAFGVPAMHIEDRHELEAAIAEPADGPRLIEIRTDRVANVGVHERIQAAVTDALPA